MVYPAGLSWGGVKIGDNVNISSYVKIISGTHDIDSPDFKSIYQPVTIGKNVWIATGAIILPGVTIAEGAVVAAGAVVTRDVDSYTVVGGIPAKYIKKRNKNCLYKVGKCPFLC